MKIYTQMADEIISTMEYTPTDRMDPVEDCPVLSAIPALWARPEDLIGDSAEELTLP